MISIRGKKSEKLKIKLEIGKGPVVLFISTVKAVRAFKLLQLTQLIA